MTERDAVFYHIGGNPRGPETKFLFIWKGHNIEIGSISHETIIEKNEVSIKTEIDWRDTSVLIPKHLQSQKQEIFEAVREAFACNNYLGKRVIFDTKMNFEADKGTGRWQ